MATSEGNTTPAAFATDISNRVHNIDSLIAGARAIASANIDCDDKHASEGAINIESLLYQAADKLHELLQRIEAGEVEGIDRSTLASLSPRD